MRLLPSLRIDALNTLWFVRPGPPEATREDTITEGHVVLDLPHARKVKSLQVALVGKQTMTIHNELHSYEVLRRELNINPYESYGQLEAGEHRFAWSFVIPSNSAPHERLGEFRSWSQDGSQPHLNVAPHGGLALAKTVYKLIATAAGCGTFGGDLVVKEVCGLVNNANEPGSAAADYERFHEEVHPILGPTRVHMHSRHFLISGFIRLEVALAAVTHPLMINDIWLVIEQSVTLQSLEKPECIEHVKPLELPLWKLAQDGQQPDGKAFEPILLERDQEYKVVKTVRLANDNYLRQSTNPWSNTGIRLSHAMKVVIRYTALENEEGPIESPAMREVEHKFKARIASCDCSVENLELPSYSKIDQSSSQPGTPGEWATKHPRDCLCNRLLKDHLENEYRYDEAAWKEQRQENTIWNEQTQKWEAAVARAGGG